jgi:DNA-directed RNA polymerase II subunit RPB1
MLDGDYVLFNRQPTLHRMSMMSHKVKVLLKGDTFRMNVAVTKPYNADFDGDEMNMHMPQNDEAEIELMNLAAIPYQIISPGNNTSIIGIFQDSLLGSYLFTEPDVHISRQEAMNLLAKTTNPDMSLFDDVKKQSFTPQEIVSSILPDISVDYKSQNIHIVNGTMMSGQIDKKFFGGGSGIIQRINNDFSHTESQVFIDDIQGIITEYMKHRGFSVGISDLIADDNTNDLIKQVIVNKKKNVLELIDDIQMGVFENKTHQSNKDLFEYQVNNILNSATQDAGKLGMDNLDENNRFVKIVKCGSKGSNINICQMISCVGQQSIDNKRIPYNYTNRTLPHYTQFDDSMEARGFVENSFIEGLTPEELYFHAMSGRVGIIDTAVKTSTTGYIQRRLIKGMEDLNCAYDGTIRNSKQKIVQFVYGTNMDPVHMESYEFKLLTDTVSELYLRYELTYDNKPKVFNAKALKHLKSNVEQLKTRLKTDAKYLLDERDEFINNVNENINDKTIYLSVHFTQIIKNIVNKFNKNRLCDVSPIEFYEIIDKYYNNLDRVYKPCRLFKTAYYYYLNPKYLLYELKINKDTLIYLMEKIIYRYKKSVLNPGEMVGMISAQSIGEPTTQMTLNTFHYAGVASKANVTRGVPRMEELLTITSNIKNPSVTIYLKPYDETNREKATELISQVEHTKLNNLITKCEIYYDPDPVKNPSYREDVNFMKEYQEMAQIFGDCVDMDKPSQNSWILRMELDKVQLIHNNITVQFIHFALKKIYGDKIVCYYNDMNETNIIFKIKLTFANGAKNIKKPLDESDNIYIIKSFQDKLLSEIAIRGIEKIDKVNIRKIAHYLKYNEDTLDFDLNDIWVLDTVGSNLRTILSLDDIDTTRTYSNSITEMKEILGIEAARKTIFNEIKELMDDAGSYINYHHISLLADRMCYNDKLVSIFRHGINNDDIGPIAKASFEETTEMFLKAARHGELDEMKGVSANVMCGQEGYYGTSAFSVFLNNVEIDKLTTEYSYEDSEKDTLSELYSTKQVNDMCNNVDIKHNLRGVTPGITETINDELDI